MEPFRFRNSLSLTFSLSFRLFPSWTYKKCFMCDTKWTEKCFKERKKRRIYVAHFNVFVLNKIFFIEFKAKYRKLNNGINIATSFEDKIIFLIFISSETFAFVSSHRVYAEKVWIAVFDLKVLPSNIYVLSWKFSKTNLDS